MRPLVLQIQAFGPFSGTERVDFRLLGEHPLFLINGPTGAGKSALLDAICFALYGQTTGNEREGAQMRCDLAPEQLPTQVQLTFQLGAKRYRIERMPQQQRPKSRGEGYTDQAAEATLYECADDGAERLMTSRKVTEANAAIEELLGLTAEQFRQVMILPQGQFRALLLADSKSREQIFSRLFQTQIYQRIEEALKQKASGIQQAKLAHDERVKGLLLGVDVADEEALLAELATATQALAAAKAQRADAQAQLHRASTAQAEATQLQAQFEEQAQTQTRLQQLQLAAPAMQDVQQRLVRAQQAQLIQPAWRQQQQAEQAVLNVQQQLSLASAQLVQSTQAEAAHQAALRLAEGQSRQIDQLKQQLQALNGYEQQQVPLVAALAQQRAQSAEVKTAEQALLAARQHYAQQNRLLKALTETVEADQMALAGLATLQQSAQRSAERLKGKQKWARLQVQQQESSAKHHQAQQALALARDAVEAADVAAKTKAYTWHSQQAAWLAAQLQAGLACPVCGSTTHPAPALAQGDLVDEASVAEANEGLAQAVSAQHQAEQAVHRWVTELNLLAQQLAELEAGLGEWAAQSVAELEVAAIEAEAQWQDLLRRQAQAETHRQQLKQQTQALQEAQTQGEALAQTLQQAEKQLAEQAVTVGKLEALLPEAYRRPEALAQARDQAQRALTAAETRLHNAQTAWQTSQAELAAAVAHQANAERQLQAAEQARAEAQAQWQQQWQAYFKDEAEQQVALASPEAMAQWQVQLAEHQEALQTQQGRLAGLAQLLQAKERPDMAALQATQEAAASVVAEQEALYETCFHRYQALTSTQRKLLLAHKANAELEAEFAIYGTLNEVASGRHGAKINLQRFVLSVLLDDVLIQASTRLRLMSKGRYTLLRKDEKSKGNRASGLDLQVEDAYTGKARDVATLSGGESFLAALALALGLSDVVQAYSGGVRLDTLFIDEGFGSLDSESLDLAMNTLIDLQASGRMIGLISHVSELKEQMLLRIDVVPSLMGSRIRLHETALS